MAGVRQFDEEATLDKALDVFWSKGFAKTTMLDLAAATGVQRGSLYNAYQDKETIFLRVFARYQDRYLDSMRSALAAPRLRDALQAYLDYAIDSLTTGMPTRSCLSTRAAFGGDEPDETIRLALLTMLDAVEALLAERLAHPAVGETLALAPQGAAQMVVTFTRGLVVIERIYHDKEKLRTTARMLLDLLLGAGK